MNENLDMNTVMILPEVCLALQIQSLLCFLLYLTSSILLLCLSCSDVLCFQITVSFIFCSLITSWKMILQHNFQENRSTLLKHSFSCMAVFYIITIQLWVIKLIWKFIHHNNKSPKISLITIRHSVEHYLSPLCELTCKWIHIKPWILKAIYRHNLYKDTETPNKLQPHLSWPNETQYNTGVNATTNQVDLPLGHLPDRSVSSSPVCLKLLESEQTPGTSFEFVLWGANFNVPINMGTYNLTNWLLWLLLTLQALSLFKHNFKKNSICMDVLGYAVVLWAYIDMKAKT